MITIQEYLDGLYAHKGTDAQQMHYSYVPLLDALLEDDIAWVDGVLDQIDLKRVRSIIQIGILRTIHMYKDKFSNWDSFINKVRAYSDAHGRDSNHDLRGLI